MRAAVLHGPEDLRVETVADPEAAVDELVVHVEAATTCGTERGGPARKWVVVPA